MPEPLAADDLQRLIEARHHDPFAYLGRHPTPDGKVVLRAFLPEARWVRIVELDIPMERHHETGLFVWEGDGDRLPPHPTLQWADENGRIHREIHPYTFAPVIGDFDLHLFGEGKHHHAYRFLGANPRRIDGIDGVLFAVWAPNAERVSVVGEFNRWDGRRHPMRVRGGSGVWELFIPGIQPGALYKFEIRSRITQGVEVRTDPYGKRFELRPGTAAIVTGAPAHHWGDDEWMAARAEAGEAAWLHGPISIYEVHLGSWRRGADGRFLNYRELAHQLVDYVQRMGYTHIELLPITEHPLDASWGYQTTGYYAPTSRFGSPDDFRYLVDHCHRHGIGVYLDWVPGHFPADRTALARFDGTALYEHEDPRRGEHKDWGTLIFNYGRNEVRNFLLSSACYWLEEFHLDGLRVDAVASMLYLDYSRKEGEWLPNIHGGRENLEAIDFLRQLNDLTHGEYPGTVTMAEESTAWPQVSRPTWLGGLGFSMKWNMGWMHDTLDYLAQDPLFRRYHHDRLTFGLLYAFSENFVLPLSHDEVVHGKGSLRAKMPGDDWQKMANLRLLYSFMYTYPGKKLLFQGNDIAQASEWNHDGEVDWGVLQWEPAAGLQRLLADLNHLYRERPELHRRDFDPDGFAWIDCHDADNSVISYQRRDDHGHHLIVILNFTPVVHHGYRIGVPHGGGYRELLNSDSTFYGGSNTGNGGHIPSQAIPWMGQPHSLELTLPPLGALILAPA